MVSAAIVLVSPIPALATFKLATWVVDVTINGAVPVATLEVNETALTAALT